MRALWLALALSLAPLPARARGVTARLAYDSANAGINGGNGWKTSDNSQGTLAWAESYVMMSHAAMYRATGDPSYLVQLADHALTVLARRDSALGLKDYAGKSRPCWQSTKYSPAAQPFCWVVHSGMITYPMAELVRLVMADSKLKAVPVTSFNMTLGSAAQTVLAAVEETVATHASEWKSGPASGEGHYLSDPAATFLITAGVSMAGKPLPLNQMSALGQTIAILAAITTNADHQAKLKALCTYLRNRMTVSGATLVWTYWGEPWVQGKGEDISHAAINVELARLCQASGQVFTSQDLGRLARTLFEGVHLDTGTVADLVDGGGTTNTYKHEVGRWVSISPFDARVWPVAANIFREATATSGSSLLGLALLAEHAPRLRAYEFHQDDWQDLGDYRKALKGAANMLLLPPVTTQPCVFKLGYRTSKTTTVQQWNGNVYHRNLILAPTGTAFEWASVPYDPKDYFSYQGKVLYQLTDAFVAGQGIEVKEVAAVVDPAITTTSLPPAPIGAAYSAAAKGAGDAPLLWSVVQGPAGLSIDAQSGQLSWTAKASDAPGASVTLRLQNDSGEAERTLTIPVGAIAAGDGGRDLWAGESIPVMGDRKPPSSGGCGCALVGERGDRAPRSALLLAALLICCFLAVRFFRSISARR